MAKDTKNVAQHIAQGMAGRAAKGRAARHAPRARADAAEGLAAVVRLSGYRRFLADVRSEKSRSDVSACRDIDTEILGHARDAADDARTAVARNLRVLRTLRSTGSLTDMMDRYAQAADGLGALTPHRVFTDVIADPKAAAALAKLGIAPGLLKEVSDVLARANFAVRAEGGRLVAEQTGGGDAPELPLIWRDTPKPAGKIRIVERDRFRILSELLENRATSQVDVVHRPATTLRLEDGILAGGAHVALDLERHVRKLEDTGLAVYEGSDPITLGIVLGIIGLLMIGIGYLMCALAEGEAGEDFVCAIGDNLIVWGMLVLALGVCAIAGPGGVAWCVGAMALALIGIGYMISQVDLVGD